ncbi:hypothetical protein Tco_0251816 [Tanacetum coccineum]
MDYDKWKDMRSKVAYFCGMSDSLLECTVGPSKKETELWRTLSTSSKICFDVESLAKLTVKEYAMVNDPYNVQNGHNMTKLLQMKLELKVKELEI